MVRTTLVGTACTNNINIFYLKSNTLQDRCTINCKIWSCKKAEITVYDKTVERGHRLLYADARNTSTRIRRNSKKKLLKITNHQVQIMLMLNCWGNTLWQKIHELVLNDVEWYWNRWGMVTKNKPPNLQKWR